MTILVKNSAIKPLNKHKSERFFNLLSYVLISILIFGGISFLWDFISRGNKLEQLNRRNTLDLSEIHQATLENDVELPRGRNANCTYWDCFNVYKCGQREQDRLSIYVYPLKDYVDPQEKQAFILTKEYYAILKTIIESPYYTSNPNEACIFVTSIDTLNQNLIDVNLVGKALASLEYWENGDNHLLFNMLPGAHPEYNRVLDVNTDRAIIVGAGFDSWTYRIGFDISLPVWSPILQEKHLLKTRHAKHSKKYLLIVAQLNLLPRFLKQLKELAHENSNNVLLLHQCPLSSNSYDHNNNEPNDKDIPLKDVRCSFPRGKEYDYPNILQKGTFCLLGKSIRLGQPDFLEMLAYGCIPVIMADNYVLPFVDVIDWELASIRIREADLHSILTVLNAVSPEKIGELQEQINWLYEKYFSSIQKITLTTLEILNDRVFPHLARNSLQWNTRRTTKSSHNPLFLPLIATKSQGFTAVILTYDRIESLFTLIQKLAVVPSLQKILVIWNNQRKSPPHPSVFPKISKQLKVIQTKANKLSNRFFPYDEIETEAILTIDDDIVMLTADELDFGYEVWREFPDRIVGFPSRTHVWDNVTNRWRYESEWTNQISMVLTGAAFHHKYWSYMYTNSMPGDIKEWVDEHMNCEDIAMNFLVANITNKPPIKVAPRKKFKCPECTNTEMLSADLNHMMERSACIDRFAKIYGTMPLKTVEFRADPVLYKDNFPEKLKRFNDIGSL